MKCPKCDYPKNLKAKPIDFDYSETCGIPGTILKGVDQYTCPKCNTTFQDLGDADDVTNAITDILLAQATLTRSAVRFIRTHLFQESYFEFGNRTGINPQFLRDLENLVRPLSQDVSQRVQDEVIKHRASKVKIDFEI